MPTQVKRAYLYPSLTDIGPMKSVCQSRMEQVDLCAYPMRASIFQALNWKQDSYF